MRSILITAAVAGLVVACGGGGSSGPGNTGGSPTLPGATFVSLNSSNQNLASQEAASSSFMPLAGPQTLTGALMVDESVLFSIARDQLDKFPIYIANARANSVLPGVIATQTIPCPSGGSMTASANDVDNNGILSAGDNLNITANNCALPQGTASGSLGYAINNLSGTFGSTNYSVGMTISFSNFSLSAAQFNGAVNGDMTLSLKANGVNSSTATISSSSLMVSGSFAGESRTRQISNYSVTVSVSPDPTYIYRTSYAFNGVTLTSTAFSSQAMSISTTTPFITRSTDQYPSSGVMILTGANNSKIRVTALDKVHVQQELDANGDGTYESTATVLWNALM